MKEAGRRIRFYRIDYPPEMLGMADCAVRGTTAIRDAMPLLGSISRDFQSLTEMQRRVRGAESEADELLSRALDTLFSSDVSTSTKLTVEKVYDLIDSVGPLRRHRRRHRGNRGRTGLTEMPSPFLGSIDLKLVSLVAVALLFDFLNSLHDSANSIATVVSTRVLPPLTAVFWAAFFDFIAFFVFGLHVANTVGRGLVAAGVIDERVMFGALVGAIIWNLITWMFGMPSSSSHALIGGLVGAGMAKAGPAVTLWKGLSVVVATIIGSPLVGFLLSVALVIGASLSMIRTTPFAANQRFRWLQLISSSLISLGRGGDDAQKTMGIIAVLLVSAGAVRGPFHVPLWVILACQAAMALGTSSGGWRIVRMVGARITDLKPPQESCAETGGAIALFGATWFGIPVSTTHTVTGTIVGVGAMRRASAVRCGNARQIVIAWVVMIPASACMGAAAYVARPWSDGFDRSAGGAHQSRRRRAALGR